MPEAPGLLAGPDRCPGRRGEQAPAARRARTAGPISSVHRVGSGALDARHSAEPNGRRAGPYGRRSGVGGGGLRRATARRRCRQGGRGKQGRGEPRAHQERGGADGEERGGRTATRTAAATTAGAERDADDSASWRLPGTIPSSRRKRTMMRSSWADWTRLGWHRLPVI